MLNRPTLVLAALALAVTGVTGAVGAAEPALAREAATSPPEPERFTGSVDEFYAVPDPLPPGDPGELIRVQDVASGGGSTTVRVMYHSRDARDRDRAVTGIVTYPDRPAPPGGWPVVSLANGTVGLASPCALSRLGRPAPTFGVTGVGVVSDYIGLGPVGETHPYLSRPSEGHSVIDAVRAARNLTETGAGKRWLAIGHSQGGHGALAAHELAHSYAPELHLLGTVSLAPAAMFDRTYGGIDDIVSRIVTTLGLYGGATEHPEIDPDDYVGPQVAAVAADVFPDQCLDAIVAALAPIPADAYFTHDPRTTEPARSIILANDVGNVAAHDPVLLVSGTADQRVVIDRARDLFDRLCATGQVTEYTEYPGATHDDIVPRAGGQITRWMADRLARARPVDSCAGGAAPGPPTPSAAPAAAVRAEPTFTG
jgi:fermentation-respiration switch protein FrsA (DUF1100 family)